MAKFPNATSIPSSSRRQRLLPLQNKSSKFGPFAFRLYYEHHSLQGDNNACDSEFFESTSKPAEGHATASI